MANNALHKVVEQAKENRRRNRWNKIVTGMAALVVFCTTYALILPAITEEREPMCGLEEHVHTEKCYALPKLITCPYEKDAENGTLHPVVHVHDALCYDTEGNLICAMPELESHVHDYRCYTDIEAQPPHVHSDECYEDVEVLICGQEESEGHAHSADCFDESGSLICELPESEGHTHTADCYETQHKLICEKDAVSEEEAAALEGTVEHVLICGKDERILHQHTADCRDENGVLVCGMQELFAHQHGPECLSTTKDPEAKPVLICGLEAHTHDDTCYTDLEADLETPEMWEALLPDKTGVWADDLLAVAVTQLGYEESTANVTVTPEGAILGYTRYGQWAGAPYGDWSLNFLDFCQHYAGIPADAFPVHEGQLRWCDKLSEENWNIYWTPAQYTPVPGDTVFLDMDVDGRMDSAAVVWQLTEAAEDTEAVLTVIQGDVSGAVAKAEYQPTDPVILGYGSLAAAKSRWDILNPPPAPEPVRYCGLEEHTHGEGCYDAEQNLICEIPEHTHADACLVRPAVYYCGLEEHTHDERCYDNEGNRICGLEEHTHQALCQVESPYCCGKEEHEHTDACYDENNVLICGLEAHAHGESCMLKEQSVEAEIVSSFDLLDLLDGPKNSVTISGLLPEGVTATAVPVEVEGMEAAFDITLKDAAGNEFQPISPVQVSFHIPGLTDDPELLPELQPCHILFNGEEGQAPEIDPLPVQVGDEGSLTAEVPHFSYVGIMRLRELSLEEDGCEIQDTWYNWIPATNDNPFGSAQHFNVFILGDVVGFNAIHGNAAIGGSVYGEKNTTIGYPEGSNFNYEADSTAENEICLILRGSAYRSDTAPDGITPLPSPLEVANGTAVIRDELVTQYEFDTAPTDSKPHLPQVSLNNYYRPKTHIHQVSEDHWDRFDDFFWAAGMESEIANESPDSLLYHNQTIYDYCYGLYEKYNKDPSAKDPHLGYNALIKDVPDEMKVEVLGPTLQGASPDDIFLHGDNPFYNVFNLRSDKVKPDEHGERKVWLDVPVGSYVLINVLGRDEDGKPISNIENFGMQFWYRTTEDKWTKQPAEIRSMHGEGFNQSQMLLVNMDPNVTDVTYCNNNYFQASILAPKANMHCDTVNLEGTIVFKSMVGTGNNNIVYSPFYTGTSMNLSKETTCDTPGVSHEDINEGGSEGCQILENNWNGVYADVQFSISDSLGAAGRIATLKELPLDGKPVHYGGLPAGYYTVSDEVVYLKAHNNMTGSDYKERRLTVDEDGYWMVAMYLAPGYDDSSNEWVEDPNVNEWKLVYCDEPVTMDSDGGYVCSIPGKSSEWKVPDDFTSAAEKASAGLFRANEKIFALFRHHWNYGLFKKGYQNETPTLTVQAGIPVGDVTLVNHWSIEPMKSAKVYKEWGVWQEFDIAISETETVHKKIFVPVTPPPGASVQVTLMRSTDGTNFTPVPAEDPTEENPAGLPNPVTLHGPDSWSYMWTGLPEGDGNSSYTYKVEETSGWPGWSGTLINNGNGSFTIQNEENKYTGLAVEKEWYDEDGFKLTDEQIAQLETATETKLSSKVQLYRLTGHAPSLDDEEHRKDQKSIKVYLDEIDDNDENLLGIVPYFPGSDVDIVVDLYVVGQAVVQPGVETTGNVDEMKLLLNGKEIADSQVKSTNVYCSEENNASAPYWNHYFTSITVSCRLNDLDGFPALVLKTSDNPAAYPVMRKTEIDKIQSATAKAQVHKPQIGVAHRSYDPALIGWEEEMVPVGQPIELAEANEKWKYTWADLPLFEDPDNQDVLYGYFVVEEDVTEGYSPIYIYSQTAQSHDGSHYAENPPDEQGNRTPVPDTHAVTAGVVGIRNYPHKTIPTGPELPYTGGIGTAPYTFGGLLASSAALFLARYKVKKRRKEETGD